MMILWFKADDRIGIEAGTSQKAGQVASNNGATTRGEHWLQLKAPVEFAADDWRMIILGYSPPNTGMWLDNELIGEGAGLPQLAWWEKSGLGLVVGSDLFGSADNVARAQFEELTTLPRWPRKSDWQELYFGAGKRRALLGPLGTKEEEAPRWQI